MMRLLLSLLFLVSSIQAESTPLYAVNSHYVYGLRTVPSFRLHTLLPISRLAFSRYPVEQASPGINAPQARIFGGSSAHRYPWITAVRVNGIFVCGGTLIDNQHVLTAAHCLHNLPNLINIDVIVGDYDRSSDVQGFWEIALEVEQFSSKVREYRVHPEYRADKTGNDIAVLVLENAVPEDHPYVVSAQLPHGEDDFAGQDALAMGWGATLSAGSFWTVNVLQQVNVTIWDNEQCRQAFGDVSIDPRFDGIKDNQVCASKEGKHSCMGDDGGPLAVHNGTSWTVVGVTSWTIGCGQWPYPGVYARVSSFKEWIQEVIDSTPTQASRSQFKRTLTMAGYNKMAGSKTFGD